MKMLSLRSLSGFIVVLLAVIFSYAPANTQVVDAIKDAASKTKDVTVDAAKKTKDVTVDTTKKIIGRGHGRS